MKVSQGGFSLIEMMIASLILVTVVTIAINVFGTNMKQSAQARNQLKASELARGKLDEYKDYARRASINGTFRALTSTSFVAAYDSTNTAYVNDLKLTWRIRQTYAEQIGGTFTAMVTDLTNTAYTSKLIKLMAIVDWREGNESRRITMTTYVSDVAP